MENLSFTDKITDKEISSKESLEEIIQLIKSDRYQSICNQISTAEKTIATKLKQNHLPIFNPCVRLENYRKFGSNNNNESTGIIQFDIDECNDYAPLIKDVKKIPELLYLFRSPSGGLKFGIKTDFISNEQAFIKEGFRYAYEAVKAYITKFAEFESDDSVNTISQPCFLSHDPNAYLNIDAVPFQLIANIKKKLLDDEVKRNQNIDAQYKNNCSNTDETEVKKALSFIPPDLNHHERLNINFAVISVFGERALDILLAHWSHENPTKLERDIRTQIKISNGNIGVGTLLKIATENGYQTTSNNKHSVITTLPPSFNQQIYPLQAAQEKLAYAINDFFINGVSKLINVEAGAGKTQISIDQAYEFINKVSTDKKSNKPRPKIAIFVASHTLAEEYLIKFKEEIKRYHAPPELTSKTSSDLTKKLHQRSNVEFWLNINIQHIKGRNSCDSDGNEICNHDLKIRINSEKNPAAKKKLKTIFNDNLAKLCLHCNKAAGCEYVQQFNDSMDHEPEPNEAKRTSIRIYTHDHLFNQRSIWHSGSYGKHDDIYTIPVEKEWGPSHIIVDEDLVSKALDSNTYVEKTPYKHAPKLLKDIIHDMQKQPLFEVVTTHSEAIFEAYDEQLANLNKCKNAPSIDRFNSVEDIISTLGVIKKPTEYKVLGALKKFADRLIQNGGKSTTCYNAIYLENDMLCFADRGFIHDRFENIPTLLLDASANKSIVRSAFGERFNFESISIEYQDNVKIYQYENNTFSKNNLKKDPESFKKLTTIIQEKSQGKSIGLITYQHLETGDDFCRRLAAATGAKERAYFGHLRGINRFENLDQLFIVGRHDIGSALEVPFRQLFGGLKDDEEVLNFERSLSVSEVFRMKDGTHKKISKFGYSDSRMTALYEHFLKAETYQAVHRLRLIHGNKLKEVYILTSEVLDVTVDKLFRTNRSTPTTDKRIQQIQNYILKIGYLHKKNSTISKATGLSTIEIGNLRNKNNNFEELILSNKNIHLYEVTGTTVKNRKSTRQYFVKSGTDISINTDLNGFKVINTKIRTKIY